MGEFSIGKTPIKFDEAKLFNWLEKIAPKVAPQIPAGLSFARNELGLDINPILQGMASKFLGIQTKLPGVQEIPKEAEKQLEVKSEIPEGSAMTSTGVVFSLDDFAKRAVELYVASQVPKALEVPIPKGDCKDCVNSHPILQSPQPSHCGACFTDLAKGDLSRKGFIPKKL